MAGGNPDILIPLLDDLLDKIRFWKSKSSDILNDSQYRQVKADNVQARAEGKTRMILNQSIEDQVIAQQKRDNTLRQHQLYEAYLSDAVALEHRSLEINNAAVKTLEHWTNALQQARLRLQAAEADLANAQMELGNAQMLLRDARLAVSNAEYALNNCRNSGYKDKDGRYHAPNCSSQERNLGDARRRQEEAKRREEMARDWVRRALEEVRKAKERVAHCEKCVNYAKQAHAESNKGLVLARQAVNQAERTVEESSVAVLNSERATEKADKAVEISEMMAQHSQDAQQHTDQAKSHLRRSDQAYTSAYNYATTGEQDLGGRLDALREFAAPSELLPNGSATTTSRGSASGQNTPSVKTAKEVAEEFTDTLAEELGYKEFIQQKTIEKYGADAINLIDQEAFGGHSMTRHCSKVPDTQLEERARSNKGLFDQSRSALRFSSDDIHLKCFHAFFEQKKLVIEHWLNNENGPQDFPEPERVLEFDFEVGTGFHNEGSRKNPRTKRVQTKSVFCNLVKDNNAPRGFYVETFFPKYIEPE